MTVSLRLLVQVTRFREVTERVTVERPGDDDSPPVVTTAEQHAVRKTTMTRGAGQRKVTERPSLPATQVRSSSGDFESFAALIDRCLLNKVVHFIASTCMQMWQNRYATTVSPFLDHTIVVKTLHLRRLCGLQIHTLRRGPHWNTCAAPCTGPLHGWGASIHERMSECRTSEKIGICNIVRVH